ncbi:MAG: hypothetical protein JWR03_1013, partial [Cohnella sp.]|nr:hypothetical protein [Cohnella sp.]
GMDAPLVYQLFRQEHRWVAKCGRDKR